MESGRFELFRQDIKDLSELTVAKMDNYLIINTLKLGFCVELFTEGKLPEASPEWLVWLAELTLMGAFMHLLCSIWSARRQVDQPCTCF